VRLSGKKGLKTKSMRRQNTKAELRSLVVLKKAIGF